MASRTNKLFSTPMFTIPESDIANRDGYPAYSRSLEEQTIQVLNTNTLGNVYYAEGKDLLKEAEGIFKKMLKKDPVFFAKALIHGRNEGYMRTVPTFGLVMLSEERPDIFSVVFYKVIKTPKDLSDFMTMVASRRKGSQGGRAIKRSVGKWLSYHFGEKGINAEYWTIKYGSGQREGFTLADIVKTTHPTGMNKDIANYILDKDARVTKAKTPKLYWFDKLKSADSTESMIKAITEGQLPHEVASTFAGSQKDVWGAIFPNLPIFALLRNLATLSRHGVLKTSRKEVEAMFKDTDRIHKAKIFPFRFLDAYNAIKEKVDSWVLDSLRDGIDASFENIPDFPGTTAVFLDISGSMSSYLEQSALFGVCCALKGSNNKFYLFNTETTEARTSRRVPILDQAQKIHIAGGTDVGSPFRRITKDREKVDNIILITDEQQNTGSPAYRAFMVYRSTVNPKAKLFVVCVAPYRSSVIPKNTDDVWYIYGWNDNVLRYIAYSLTEKSTQVDLVNNTELFLKPEKRPEPTKVKKPLRKAAKKSVRKTGKNKER
jgi:60 kDa SS-A/Ro ribonucleoprotein